MAHKQGEIDQFNQTYSVIVEAQINSFTLIRDQYRQYSAQWQAYNDMIHGIMAECTRQYEDVQ